MHVHMYGVLIAEIQLLGAHQLIRKDTVMRGQELQMQYLYLEIGRAHV